jgi:hypothetical protein
LSIDDPSWLGIQGLSPLRDAVCMADPSTSHPVAGRGGCTNIPLAAVWA